MLKYTKKGQIIMLDVLFAAVFIVFLFLLLSKITEVNIYNTISNNNIEELQTIGLLTYNRLLNNPEINCYVDDSDNHYLISSCFSPNSNITKGKLNLPNGYKCNLEFTGGFSVSSNECNDSFNADDIEHYFAISQEILTYPTTTVNKRDHKDRDYVYREITLRVWKNE
jgi:hypothetical protein